MKYSLGIWFYKDMDLFNTVRTVGYRVTFTILLPMDYEICYQLIGYLFNQYLDNTR